MKKNFFKQLASILLIGSTILCFGAASAPSTKKSDINKFVTKTIRVDDSVISFNMTNVHNKKVLILQHGAFMNNLTMMGLAQKFSEYCVIVPDLPNHGKSVTSRQINSVEDLANIEYDFIVKLKSSGLVAKDADITYAGWSMGGSIGLCMATREKIFNRLVLIDSSPIWDTIPLIPADQFHDTFKAIFDSAAISKDTTPARAKWMKDNFESMLASVDTSENDITILRKFNIIDKLGSVNVPVLMVSGENDSLALVSRQILMSEKITDNKIALYGYENHGMVVGCTEKVSTEIQQFIASHK